MRQGRWRGTAPEKAMPPPGASAPALSRAGWAVTATRATSAAACPSLEHTDPGFAELSEAWQRGCGSWSHCSARRRSGCGPALLTPALHPLPPQPPQPQKPCFLPHGAGEHPPSARAWEMGALSTDRSRGRGPVFTTGPPAPPQPWTPSLTHSLAHSLSPSSIRCRG